MATETQAPPGRGSSALLDKAQQFVESTKQHGGATFMTGADEFLPVGHDDRVPNRFIVGGAHNEQTGTRFPTQSVHSSQFGKWQAAEHMLRTKIQTGGRTDVALGSWVDPDHPDTVELDVSDVHAKKREARQISEGRREKAFFQTRGMKTHLTSHGKKARAEARG